MKLIPVKGGHFAQVDDADYDRLIALKWRMHDGYAVTGVKSTRMHRLLLDAGDLDVDHRDTNRLNNQRGNLRKATRSQNIQNSRPRHCAEKSSRFKGVNRLASGRWRARIKADGKHLPLGCYGSESEAAAAYNRAAMHYFGEFARLNVI